jgi:hypothetical protein
MFAAGSTTPMAESGKITDLPLARWEREGSFMPPEGLFAWAIAFHPWRDGTPRASLPPSHAR